MKNTFEIFKSLPINRALLSLEDGDCSDNSYFCYPVNAKPIGFEGSILYCFLPEYGEVVFAANPESCADKYVYPLAENFSDFMRLVLACGTANPVEQIVWMNKDKFQQHLQEEQRIMTQEQKAALSVLAEKLELAPMENPFEYVKALQSVFDDSKIQFSDEYYDVLGIER